jgi:hypothetical protein
MARRRNEIVPETSSRFGRGPLQFRTRNDLTKAQRTRSNRSENAVKSTKLIDIRSGCRFESCRAHQESSTYDYLISEADAYRTRNAKVCLSSFRYSAGKPTFLHSIRLGFFTFDRRFGGCIERIAEWRPCTLLTERPDYGRQVLNGPAARP